MPAPTWRWLKLNYYDLMEVEQPEAVSVEIDPDGEVEAKESREFSLKDIKTGMGEDISRIAAASGFSSTNFSIIFRVSDLVSTSMSSMVGSGLD